MMKKLALTLLLPLVATMLQGAAETPASQYGAYPHTAAARIQRAWRNKPEIAQPDFELFEKTHPSMSSKAQMAYLLDADRYDAQALKKKKAPKDRRISVSYPKRKKIAQLWHRSSRRNKWLMTLVMNAHRDFVKARMNNFPFSGADVPMMTRGMFEAFSRAVQARLCDAFARLANDRYAVISYEGGKSDMVSMVPPEGYTVDNLYALYRDLWLNMDPGVQEAFYDYLEALNEVSMKIKKHLKRKLNGKVIDVRMKNSRADYSYDAAHQALIQKGMEEIIADGFVKVYENPMIGGYSLDDAWSQFDAVRKDTRFKKAIKEMNNVSSETEADLTRELGFESDDEALNITPQEAFDKLPDELPEIPRPSDDTIYKMVDDMIPQKMKDRTVRFLEQRADVLPHTMGL